VTVAGARTDVSPVAVTPALLGRAFAGAEITDLDHQLARQTGAAAGKLRAEIVRRSIAARVVSSQTSMLVLESDADYARYGIDRRALAEILAIGATGVELVHRVAPPVQMVTPEPPVARKPEAKKQAERDGKLAERAAGVKIDKDMLDNPLAKDKSGADSGPAADDDDDAPRKRVAMHADAPAPEPTRNERQAGVRNSASAGSAGGAAAPALREGYRVAGQTRVEPPPPPPASPLAVRTQRLAQSGAISDRDADGIPDVADNDDGMAESRRRPALHGPLAEIERELAAGHTDAALARAGAWHKKEPGDVLALIGLGDALEAKHDLETAARVYGSIIDLFPARADFRRFAGERLERLGKAQRALIIDTYRRAVEERPDHLTGHRMLAYALVRDGQYAAAFAAILTGIDHQYPSDRFAGAERVLAEDVGMIGAAYVAHGGKRDDVMAELTRRHLALATQPSTRFIMYWETDANDVDFHIRDARGGHAWYSQQRLASGGELYADITTGYGPECFAIPGTPKAGPYRLSINYYSQGPMGYGMGLLQIQKFDGQGNLSFEDRPYVIMTDHAFVDLGTFR